jgi:acyl-CoA hydrolase
LSHHPDLDQVVDSVVEALDKNIVMGIPLGIGKPAQFVNALYARAKKDPSIKLRMITALSLERPKPSPGLEARFLEPVFERLFDGYVGLDYVEDLKKQQIPDNIQLCEFFFKSGSMLQNNYAQQHYISSNYTHVARDMIDQGVNLLVQQVSKGEYQGAEYLSLSSNTDVTVDILPLINEERSKGKTIKLVGMVNSQLPFMLNDALVRLDAFDYLIDNEAFYTPLFSPPNMPVTPVDFAIGMHASALVKDGGTLQIGIGSMGDAIVYACLLKDRDNTLYNEALDALGGKNYQEYIDRIGSREGFSEGLYGSSEMFVNGFLHLIQGGIVKRKVYGDVHIQRLINEGRMAEDIKPEHLDNLIESGFFGDVFHAGDVVRAKRFGILNERVDWIDGQLTIDGAAVGDRTRDDQTIELVKERGLGKKLRGGIIMHGGFFLGPKDFYQALHAMSDEEKELICMTGVGHVNQLLIDEDLVVEQRKQARFINTGLMATLNGAVVSDGLDDGKIVSGVGGQYNFVSMAHSLPDARSILLVRSTRTSKGEVMSNIVYNYGHITIPRHLRDTIITEYGVADIRGKTDADVMKAMLNIADSRFQEELLSKAKQAGKLPEDYVIPEPYRNNLPDRVNNTIDGYRKHGHFPAFPLGTDFTEQELQIGAALKHLKALQSDKLSLFKTVFKAFTDGDHEQQAMPFLERMKLVETKTKKEEVEKKLLIHELIEAGLIK